MLNRGSPPDDADADAVRGRVRMRGRFIQLPLPLLALEGLVIIPLDSGLVALAPDEVLIVVV